MGKLNRVNKNVNTKHYMGRLGIANKTVNIEYNESEADNTPDVNVVNNTKKSKKMWISFILFITNHNRS